MHQGLSIPLNIQVVFQNNIKKFIQRGELKDIFIVLEGITYKAKLVNQKFDERKYLGHKDILQIRFTPQSAIAEKLRNNFESTYKYVLEQRSYFDEKQRKYIKIPEDKKEYLVIYTTEY